MPRCPSISDRIAAAAVQLLVTHPVDFAIHTEGPKRSYENIDSQLFEIAIKPNDLLVPDRE
jgi:hypothetical protein